MGSHMREGANESVADIKHDRREEELLQQQCMMQGITSPYQQQHLQIKGSGEIAWIGAGGAGGADQYAGGGMYGNQSPGGGMHGNQSPGGGMYGNQQVELAHWR